jgi:hypothetical protein
MKNHTKIILVSLFVLIFLSLQVQAVTWGALAVDVICSIARVFRSIATGIAALVMVIAGIKWTASENDPGARKSAKDAMVHALVGLIIISIIGPILTLFIGPGMGGICVGFI